MTGHKGDSEFCFPEVEGKQNSLFPEGPVFKYFGIPPDSRVENTPKKMICLTPLHTLAALAKLSGCQNQPVLSQNHDKSFSSQLTKNIDSFKVALASSDA